jgi:hypothetical protein
MAEELTKTPGLAVVRAVLVTAGRPVLRRASAMAAGIGIAATIVFGGSGLPPADLVHLLHGSLPARAALWTGWTMVAGAVMAPAFDAPGTRTLRAMRLPRTLLLASLLALTGAVQAPWAILFLLGDGPLRAAAVTALAIALPCSLMVAARRPRSAPLSLAAMALVAWDGPASLTLPPAVVLAALVLHVAWLRGQERGGSLWRVTRPLPAVLALALAHLLRLTRVERARLSFAALGAAAGCTLLSFSLRNDPTERPVHRAVLFMALPLTLAAATLAPPALDSEHQLLPWLRSLRVRAVAVVAAFALALATPSSALAAGAGAVAGAAGGVSAAHLGLALACFSLVIASAVAAWARLHDRTRNRNPIVFVLGAVGLAMIFVGMAAAW